MKMKLLVSEMCGSNYHWQHTAIFFSFFKPIELDGLKREITEAGIKCSMEKLMNYLDEKVFNTEQELVNFNSKWIILVCILFASVAIEYVLWVG